MNMWEDPRIVRGMQAQAAMRQKRLAAGDRLIGWKVGFGAPALLERLRISGPLIGFLTENARVPSGGSVSFAGWLKPVIEPEIAVYIGRDVPAGADRDTAAAAIAGISPAIEVVDFDEPPDDPERILGHNIYQRHVVLGAPGPARAGSASDGLTCRILRRGAEICAHHRSAGQYRRMDHNRPARRRYAGCVRWRLKAGEFIITGSVVPPLTIERDEDGVTFEADPIGGVSVRFQW